jgi:hypothetical protein
MGFRLKHMCNGSERPMLVSLTSHEVSMLGVAPSQRGLLLPVQASRTQQQPLYRAKVEQEPDVGKGIPYYQTEVNSPLSNPNTRRSDTCCGGSLSRVAAVRCMEGSVNHLAEKRAFRTSRLFRIVDNRSSPSRQSGSRQMCNEPKC